MFRRRTAIAAVTGLFFAGLVLSVLTHGRGVLHNDPARNIWIPDERTMPLQLQVAYNDRQVFFRYRWPAAQPHVYSDVLRYTDGKWQRQLRSPVGSDPDGIAEDRVAMMLDDGSVPEFQRYGGYVTVGANMRDFTGSGPDAAHRRKYLYATRKDPNDWYSIEDQATLDAQRKTGYFLDLWQWRAQLSDPLGYADDQHIAWYRLYDSGDPMFSTNWDADRGQPRWMFDPERAGAPALRWEDVQGGQSAAGKPYYLAEPLVSKLGWHGRSAILLGGDSLPRKKPDPDQLLHACAALSVEPEQVVYSGDDERDVQAANAANMRSIGALWGYRPADDDPLRWQADALAAMPIDLIDLGLLRRNDLVGEHQHVGV